MLATSGTISTPGMAVEPLWQKSALRPFAPGAIENVLMAMTPASIARPRQSTTVRSAPGQLLAAWQALPVPLVLLPEPWKRTVNASGVEPVTIGFGVSSGGAPLNTVVVTEFAWLL